MGQRLNNNHQDRLITKLSNLWKDQHDHTLIVNTAQALNARYELNRKMANEPGVEAIIEQMFGRLANSFGRISKIQNKKILDIACGSNTSKAPASLYFRTVGSRSLENTSRRYTAMFEPWFCRTLVELGANAVGIDMGDLENEFFEHYQSDLGQPGALDFLSSHSFDAVQDSRLFGSPEFTAQFPDTADRLQVAHEIVRQEQRLLKPGGMVVHSDAAELV
jgi:SAM-dependent methyltransferase